MAHFPRPSPKKAATGGASPSDLPPHFVPHSWEYEALKNLLLTPDRGQPVAVATALSGAGGFSKTTHAAALCHDEDIVENFDYGILWVTLGQTPDVSGALLTAYAALTGHAMPPAKSRFSLRCPSSDYLVRILAAVVL